MTLNITNIKFTNIDIINAAPHVNFTADYIDDDAPHDVYTLNISYRPTADNINLYDLHFQIASDPYSSEIDTIDDSQYFDDDTINFIVNYAHSLDY